MFKFECVKKSQGPSKHGKDGKNLNSETSSGIFELLSFYPWISRKFPDFKSKFHGKNREIKFPVYFTDRRWKYFFQVQTYNKLLQIEYISSFRRFQNGFICSVLEMRAQKNIPDGKGKIPTRPGIVFCHIFPRATGEYICRLENSGREPALIFPDKLPVHTRKPSLQKQLISDF
jgi:hypothetical protein